MEALFWSIHLYPNAKSNLKQIGHTRLTHSYLLKREEQVYCIGYDTLFTVRHFLLDCADFDGERRSLFQVDNLKDFFKDVSVENIYHF